MKYVNDSKRSSKHEAFEAPLVAHMGHLDPNMKYLIASGTQFLGQLCCPTGCQRHPVE